MLKLNKILSKKIKFSLPLRGDFSHIIARERSDRSNLNPNGFSLIELMVAVVILALVAFGIFQAFVTSFQSMAEARDRTEAVNYLQETIEDYKNMYFDEIQNKTMSPIPGTKYSQGAIVILKDKEDEDDEIITLKRVIAQIRWIDRDGDVKTEKASTLIYKKSETSETGTEAVELVLYAQSYYTILPDTDVKLIVEIHDENGNIYDYNGQIDCRIITEPKVNLGGLAKVPKGEYSGALDIIYLPISANNGVAFCYFLAGPGTNVEGIERISALANVDGNDLTDTVNIRVTTGPVAIMLETDVDELPAEEGESTTVDLTIVKADYTESADSYNGSISLSAEGPGTLSTDTITFSGETTASFTVTFKSDETPGVVEITASADDLDMGYTEITFYGEPASILVKPKKTSVYPNENIKVNVIVVDENNFPVDYSGNLSLSCNPDYGVFDPNPGTLSGSSMETTFKVDSDAIVGDSITLEATGDGGISGSAVLSVISPLTAKYIRLSANPSSVELPPSGDTSTTITATIFDKDWKIVPTYNETITFYAKVGETIFGTFSGNGIDPSLSGGIVSVDLTPSQAGTVTVTAISGDLELEPEGGIEVIFYNPADHIELSADPSSIEANGNDTSTITGVICDSSGNRVTNYGDNEETVNISTNVGLLRKSYYDDSGVASLEITEFVSGEFTVYFSSIGDEDVDATVTAYATDLTEHEKDTVTITCTGNTTSGILLNNVINWDDYYISFDIHVTNSPLYLSEIDIEWDDKNAILELNGMIKMLFWIKLSYILYILLLMMMILQIILIRRVHPALITLMNRMSHQ